MPRIAGVDIPRNKRIDISLTYIFGIGRKTANVILDKANIDPSIKADSLSAEQVQKIRNIIDDEYRVEGSLRADIQRNIKRLMEVRCYRGTRHMHGLPARGQKTHSNARTRKGPRRKTASTKKK